MIEGNKAKMNLVKEIMTEEEIKDTYYLGIESMATLNKNSAKLMKKYKSHGATDITGFGILGHAQNLAAAQKNDVDLVIHSLPILSKMGHINSKVLNFKLMEGFSAETSGGLFMMLPKEHAKDFIQESLEVYG